MNILYGVSGDNFGHSSRALAIGKYLEGKGHNVLIVSYEKGYEVLKDKFDCFEVKGLVIVLKNSIVKNGDTVLRNLFHFPKNIFLLKKFFKKMREFKPDLCITDFEPLVPLAAKLYHLPLISIDNMHSITNTEISVPIRYKKDFILGKMIIRSMVHGEDYSIITSFSNQKVKKKFMNNSFIVPPIIRGDVLKLKPSISGRVLVYLNSENENIIKTLEKVNEKFIVYGYDRNIKKGNIEFRTRNHFLKDLRDCKAIIATAGFSLISEALYLRKPYFALPLRGQVEQVLNSLFLKEAGFGEYSEKLNPEEINNFLDNLESYRKNISRYKFSQKKLFQVLEMVLKSVKMR